jgi:very-short-patch-repair endonuclease
MRGEREVAELGARRDGVVRSDLAATAGVSAVALNRMRNRGLLVPLGRGVDRLRDHPFDLRCRCRAALDLAGTASVLGGRTAARLHGLYAYRDCDEIEVRVPHGRDHRLDIATVVESRWLPSAHITEVAGLPVTTLARTFFDLCANPDPGMRYRHPAHERKMVRVYNDALARHGLTFAAQSACLVVLAKRGRRGTAVVRNILLQHPPETMPTQSEDESLFMELVRAYGLPDPEKQQPLSDERGFIGVVDFLWRRARLVVEIDSVWHDGPLDQTADRDRDDRLIDAGYTVKRWRHRDLIATPGAIALELAAAVRT